MTLPLRNWKQTTQQVKSLGKTIQGSYSNYKRAEKQVSKGIKRVKYEYNKTKKQIDKVGLERSVVGRKSIYDERPSATVRKKVKEVKRSLGFGLYG